MLAVTDHDPAEILHLLAIKAADMAPGVAGFGALKPADIAHALGTVRKEASQLVLVKYLHQYEDLPNLADRVFRFVCVNWNLSGWQIPRPNFIRDMVRLALVEYVDPNICPTCAGVGSVTVNPNVITCLECQGSGKRKIFIKDRAKAMDIDGVVWKNHWQKRYDNVYYQLAAWDDQVKRALVRQLKGLTSA